MACSGASVCAMPPDWDMVDVMARDDLGDRLGLYVYVPVKGWGRFSLPAMKSEVRGSLGSRAEPTSCWDSGGRDMDKGFMSRTWEVENGPVLNWKDVGETCSDLSWGVTCPDVDPEALPVSPRCGETGCCWTL